MGFGLLEWRNCERVADRRPSLKRANEFVCAREGEGDVRRRRPRLKVSMLLRTTYDVVLELNWNMPNERTKCFVPVVEYSFMRICILTAIRPLNCSWGSTHKPFLLLFLVDKDIQNDRIHVSFRYGMSSALKIALCSVALFFF